VSRPTDDTIRDIYFASEKNGWIVCERSIYQLKTKEEPRTYLMKTMDGGNAWQRVNIIGADSDARLLRAIFTDKGRGWAFGEGGVLYATRDGGASWSRRPSPTRFLLLGGPSLMRTPAGLSARARPFCKRGTEARRGAQVLSKPRACALTPSRSRSRASVGPWAQAGVSL